MSDKAQSERKKSKPLNKVVVESVQQHDDQLVTEIDDVPARAGAQEKKRKKKNEIKTDETPMEVNREESPTEELCKEKKKKKRKHQDDVSSGKREKKKRKKHEEVDDGPSAELTPATSSSESKKERKEKKRRKTDLSNSLSSTDSSKATSPLASTTAAASPEEAKAFLEKHTVTIHTPEGSPGITPVIQFSQLDVPSELQSTFTDFTEPTPIQACTWPPALEGRDVVGIAETGSGKTLAFGIPALCHLLKSPPKGSKSTVSVLVVAPTRELALQTHDTLSSLGKSFGIASVAVFGGVPKEPQVKMLRNSNKGRDGMTTRIIVGTPGRILDLVQEGACDLGEVDYLVLDEADRMLDKGFENDIRNIISNTKKQRQTMMFSATWPEAVRRLATTFQRDPIRVTVGSDDLTANSRVEQTVDVFDDARSKDDRLFRVLKSFSHKKQATSVDESRILVFALYKKEASRVEQTLRKQGYSVGTLHGDMSQSARLDALERFKSGKTGLLVATDVAARGLDIPNVGVVINYTFPLTIEDYIHRIGRTGRGGKSGKSITFFTGDGHEKGLAGELARVLREGGFGYEGLKAKFPMTIKKKEHGAYGAFYREDIAIPKKPTKIVF